MARNWTRTAIKAAEELKGAVRIFTVGLGSADGSLIPLPGSGWRTEFVKDESGQIVKIAARRRSTAENCGSDRRLLRSPQQWPPAEMQHIVRDGLGQMNEQEIDAKLSRHPIERYQWPLARGRCCCSRRRC